MGISITKSELKLYKSDIPCHCIQCDKTFGISKSDAYRVFKGTRKKDFCSRKCAGEYKTKTHTSECNCKECGVLITKKKSAVSENNFCSCSCAATFNNKHRKQKMVEPLLQCLLCENPVRKNASKYCSLKCQQKFQTEIKIKQWLEGDLIATTGKALLLKSFIRKYLKDGAGNKCSKCGWDEINPVTRKCPLEINHIDGNATNNDISNLEVICPNCHALTPNFRALNKTSLRNRK